jgi:hypothetical protein
MATKYWVGGDGTWDASTTTNWADSSGGAGGAVAPTAADDVVFDAASNVGASAFLVTIGAGAVCQDFSTGGAGGALDGVMTLAGSAAWTVYGSLTFPAASLTRTYTGTITFAATSTGKTITTNGVTLTGGAVIFDGVGGGWTLGSALTVTGNITLTNGAFATANFSVTAASLISSNTNIRSINLGSSTVTLTAGTPIDFAVNANLSLTPGTSNIVSSTGSPTFNGGGLTFYNVSFTTAGASTKTITGANTFNNFSVTSTSGTRSTRLFFGANQTVSGTLTFGAANTSIRRIFVASNVVGTARTLTVAAVATLADVDFRDITATGASAPWSGTRLGNCLGNTGITFDAGVNKYWNLAAGGTWTTTAWALSSGGAVNANNIPLAQDTAIFEDTGLNAGATVSINNLYQAGTLDFSTRTLAMTFTSGSLVIYKDFTLSSAVTVNGTTALTFSGRPTQTVTSAGVSIGCPLTVNAAGSVSFADALTLANTLTFESGTIKLKNGVTSTVTTFATSGTTQKTLESTLAGSQATLSQASGTVTVQYLTIRDINAIGGATWNSYVDQGNIDAGNNDGWDFGISPIVGGNEYTYQLRSFTQPRRF